MVQRPLGCWLRPPVGTRLHAHHLPTDRAAQAVTMGLSHAVYPVRALDSHRLPAPSGHPALIYAPTLSPKRALPHLTLVHGRLPATELVILKPPTRTPARANRLSPWWRHVAYTLPAHGLPPDHERPLVLRLRDRHRELDDRPIAALILDEADAYADPAAIYPWLQAYPDHLVIVSALDPWTALWLMRLATLTSPWSEPRSHVLPPLCPAMPHRRRECWRAHHAQTRLRVSLQTVGSGPLQRLSRMRPEGIPKERPRPPRASERSRFRLEVALAQSLAEVLPVGAIPLPPVVGLIRPVMLTPPVY